MKESIGGTWIFVLVISFLALFTTFVSVSTHYSRCYKIKDEILLALERGHGINTDSIRAINDYLGSLGYSATGKCPEDGNCWAHFTIGDESPNWSGKANYCITKYQVTARNSTTGDDSTGKPVIYTDGPVGHPEAAYYGVVVFFRLEWPIFRDMFSINISGETSILYLVNDFDEINDKCFG